jgi:hypothetical protein
MRYHRITMVRYVYVCRYAVFDKDGSLSELKGFELKRRGELKMVKVFQSQVFERFLEGATLQECYGAVAEVADYWLNILDTQGEDLDDGELIDFLSENRSLTRTVEDYGEQKSVAISTAKRLAEFLGADMVKDKGLACKLLVAKKPAGYPVTERALPTTIFEAEPEIMRHYLRKWCKDSSMTDFNIRSILDWDYYRTRLAATIQKIITIPAALQRVPNPVPRVTHPEWLLRLVANKASAHRQTSLSSFFDLSKGMLENGKKEGGMDMEDFGKGGARLLTDEATGGEGEGPAGGAPGGQPTTTTAAAVPVIDAGPPLNMLESSEDVSDWLKTRKDLWKQERNELKRSRNGAPPNGSPGERVDDSDRLMLKASNGKLRPSGGKSLKKQVASTSAHADALSWSSMLRTPNRGYWQIIEIRPVTSGEEGTFQVFALTGQRKMQSFFLHMERVMYINRIVPMTPDAVAGAGCELVHKRLPHDAPPYYLYQMTIPERRFQRFARQIGRALEGGDPHVAGVYETHTPLLLRALLQLGCVARLNKQATSASISTAMSHAQRVASMQSSTTSGTAAGAAAGDAAVAKKAAGPRGDLLQKGRGANLKNMDAFLTGGGTAGDTDGGMGGSGATAVSAQTMLKEFSPSDLELLTTSAHPYLTHYSATFRVAFMYHSSSIDTAGARGITVIFVLKDTNTACATRYIIDMVASLKAEMGETSIPTTLDGALSGLDETTVNQLLSQANSAVGGIHMPVGLTMHAFFLGAQTGPDVANKGFPPLKKLFAKANESAGGHVDNAADFKPVHVANQAECWKRVSAVLSELNPDNSPRNPPCIVLAASCLPKSSLFRLVPALHDLPVILCPYSQRAECTYPGIAWTPFAAARAYVNFFRMLPWWHARLDISRYCQVPAANIMLTDGDNSAAVHTLTNQAAAANAGGQLGHVAEASNSLAAYEEPELATRMSDLFFARMLQFNKHILWASATAYPDLGGIEADAVSAAGASSSALALLTGVLPSFTQTGAQDRLPGSSTNEESTLQGASKPVPSANPHLSAPGMFRCVAVEISIQHLAVNTVLNSSHIHGVDNEGSDPLAAYEAQYETEMQAAQEEVATAGAAGRTLAATASSMDTGSCIGAFRALKRLLASWFSDYKSHGNALSGLLLQRFYTWLASSTSLLHDPALHRLVHALMRKAFDVLVRQFRASGLQVVHASFDRIIVATNRATIPAAGIHLKHVLGKISAHPLFSYLSLVPVPQSAWWHTLLFVDEFNYAGIRRVSDGEERGEERGEEEGAEGGAAQPQPQQQPQAETSVELLDTWSEQLVSECVANLRAGDDPGALDWKGLEKQFIADATKQLRIDSHWSFGDFLHSSAQAMFAIIIGNFMLKPLRESCRRTFQRMRAKFEEHVIPALQSDTGAAAARALTLTATARPAASSAARSAIDEDDDDGPKSPMMTPANPRETHGGSPGRSATREPRYGGSPGRSPGRALHASEESSKTPGSTAAKLSLYSIRSMVKLMSKEDEALEAEAEVSYVRALVATFLRDKLFECVSELNRDAADAAVAAAEGETIGRELLDLADYTGDDEIMILKLARRTASRCANPHNYITSSIVARPALPFIACVCAVLGLDDRVREELPGLRATLFATLNVGEFSPETKFADPCATVVLPDVVCKACNSIRDLDIVRDEHTTVRIHYAPEDEERGEDAYDEDGQPLPGRRVLSYEFHWHCMSCNTSYPRADLETHLVSLLQFRSLTYQTQDVVCVKCKRVRSSPLRKYCECSGAFGTAEGTSSDMSWNKQLGLWLGLATAYNFAWLRDTVETLQDAL